MSTRISFSASPRRWCGIGAIGTVLLALAFELVFFKVKSVMKPSGINPVDLPPAFSHANGTVFDLTPAQVSQFDKDGFVLLEGVFARDEMDYLEDVYQSFPHQALGPFGKTVSQAWRQQHTLVDFVGQSPLASFASDLLGTPTVRLLQDYMFGLDVNSKGFQWHADMIHVTHDSPLASFWIPLTELDPETGGGIQLAKGSHKWYTEGFTDPCFYSMYNPENLVDRPKEDVDFCLRKLDSAKVEFNNLKKGDVLVWHRWLMHRSVPFVQGVDAAKKRVAVNLRLGGVDTKFELPPYTCTSRPRWEGYHDWLQPERTPLGSAMFPQVFPSVLEIERAFRQSSDGSMTRKNFLGFLHEFLVHRPLYCVLPRLLGFGSSIDVFADAQDLGTVSKGGIGDGHPNSI